MRILQLTPGTGTYHCGSCLRDNALVRALRARGHDALIVPLYLPFFLDQDEPRDEQPVRLGGINLYLQEKLPLARSSPRWLRELLDRPGLLRWAAGRAGMTAAEGLGPMTVSMLRGSDGRQTTEVERLVAWLASEPRPDVIVLSNAMLAGLAPRLARAFGVPLVCSLQGEAPFLDALAEPWRERAWNELRERAAHVDAFVAVSAWYGELMRSRLDLDPARVHVVHNGIETSELASNGRSGRLPGRPTIGFLARLCADKGLPTLVEAFVLLRARGRLPGARLALAGACLREDEALVAELEARLVAAGLGADYELRPNLGRAEKLAFLAGLDVLSVPATYGESFGLYLLEALAAGVPVVQPRHAAFPEILAATGGGVLCEPNDPRSLAEALEELLLDENRARALGAAGRAAVLERFDVDHMARGVEAICSLVAR